MSPETKAQFASALIDGDPSFDIWGLLKNWDTSTPVSSVAVMLRVIVWDSEVTSTVDGVAVKLLKIGGFSSISLILMVMSWEDEYVPSDTVIVAE